MVTTSSGQGFTPGDLVQARALFRDRIDSLEHDIKRCFWPISVSGAPGPAFFPAVMYCFATLDYFSSFWAGWNKAPKGEDQTQRMLAFQKKYLLYPHKEGKIAIHFWRHKLMHTAEPRLLQDSTTGEGYGWSTGDNPQNHMHLVADITQKKFILHFCPPVFARDLRDGVFGPNGYFHHLRSEPDLQEKYKNCFNEFETYEIKISHDL